nr:MAG TPA: hypothetical protein [Caudoviricetes sp.]
MSIGADRHTASKGLPMCAYPPYRQVYIKPNIIIRNRLYRPCLNIPG